MQRLLSTVPCNSQPFVAFFFSLWAISGPEHYCRLFSPVLQLSAFVAFLFCQLSEALCQRCSYHLHFQSLQVLCSVSYLQPRALTQAQPLSGLWYPSVFPNNQMANIACHWRATARPRTHAGILGGLLLLFFSVLMLPMPCHAMHYSLHT